MLSFVRAFLPWLALALLDRQRLSRGDGRIEWGVARRSNRATRVLALSDRGGDSARCDWGWRSSESRPRARLGLTTESFF